MKHSFRRLVWFLALCPAAQAASSVPLNVTVSNTCRITAINDISLNYMWTAASSGSQYSYFECNQGATLSSVTVVSNTSGKAYNGARYLNYNYSSSTTANGAPGAGNGTASTPTGYKTRISITVPKNQRVPQGPYLSTLTWTINVNP